MLFCSYIIHYQPINLEVHMTNLNLPDGAIYLDNPELTFWEKNREKIGRLNVINPEDLGIEGLLSTTLDLDEFDLSDSFGISNPEEIESRGRIMEFIYKNKDFRDLIAGTEQDFSIPSGQDAFLDYFNPKLKHNPFFDKVYMLLNCLYSKEDLPHRLLEFRNFLSKITALEKPEQELMLQLAEILQKSASIEAILNFDLTLNYDPEEFVQLKELKDDAFKIALNPDSMVYGQTMFSFALSRHSLERYPAWTQKSIRAMLFPRLAARKKKEVDAFNKEYKKKANTARFIRSADGALAQDVLKALKPEIKKVFWPDIIKSLDCRKYFRLKVHVIYGATGLTLKMICMNVCEGDPKLANTGLDPNYFPKADQETYYEMRAKVNGELKNNKDADSWQKILGLIKAQENGSRLAADGYFLIKSPECDKNYKWFALNNLFYRPEIEKFVEQAKGLRTFLMNRLDELKNMSLLLSRMENLARRIKAPLSRPIIAAKNEHVISFSSLYPIHLLNGDDDNTGKKQGPIVALSNLPPINGRLICLTGTHGGGKSTAGLTLLVNLYLAQSGLLIFGENFHFNIKKAIGAVLSDDGQGSTATVLVTKLKNLLAALDKLPVNEVFVFIDELGKGTQEYAGLELGVDVLKKLSAIKASVVYNTQIMSLAEASRDRLGALCFQVDKKHAFQAGISDGDMHSLRKSVGIDKYL